MAEDKGTGINKAAEVVDMAVRVVAGEPPVQPDLYPLLSRMMQKLHLLWDLS